MDVDATVRIGKNGITDNVLNEISEQLKKRKIVKIKFLKNTNRDELSKKAESIATRVNGKVTDVRGFTVTIKKE